MSKTIKETTLEVKEYNYNVFNKNCVFQVPNPSAANDEGITALHNAICAGHFDIVKFLVENGCDVNAQDSDGWYV